MIENIQNILSQGKAAYFFELDSEPKQSKLVYNHFTKLGYKVTLDTGAWSLTTIQP
jgi:hypothetical protein